MSFFSEKAPKYLFDAVRYIFKFRLLTSSPGRRTVSSPPMISISGETKVTEHHYAMDRGAHGRCQLDAGLMWARTRIGWNGSWGSPHYATG
jgi:hypothetical protein